MRIHRDSSNRVIKCGLTGCYKDMMSFNNKGGGEGSMSVMTSSTTRRASDIVSDQFPVGLRVLAVDDDVTCLIILEKMLRKCLYEVTTCKRAEVALSLLRENRSGFDIVISDIHIPDMDGFKFLELIILEMDLPVIMVSADESKDAVMRGVTQGACDFLIKPLRIEAIKNIWQHVIRKRRNEMKEMEQSGSVVDGEQHHQILSDDADYASSISNGNWRNSKRRKDDEVEGEDGDDTPTLKRPRVVWTPELHKQFVAAVTQLGVEKAVPKKILELMNVPELTRENVASHLQKYRLFLRRRSGQQQHQNGLGTPFMSPEEVNFRPMPSLDKLDLHALAVSGQLPQKGLATLPAGFGSSTESSGMGMPLVDEKDHFNFETTKLKFGGGQKLSNSSKRVELPPGLLATMEPKQLAHLHQSVQSLGNTGQHVSEGVLSFLNLPMSMRMSSPIHMDSVHGNQNSSLVMPIAQPQLKVQISYEIVGSHPLSLPSSMDHQISSNDTGSWFLGMDGTGICGGGAIGHPISRALANHATELPKNNFHLRNTAMTPLSQEIEHQNIQNLENTAQRHYCFLVDDFYRLKVTNISDFSSETLFLGEHFAKDDLMDSLLKQTQGDVATVENELNFDEYPNILG